MSGGSGVPYLGSKISLISKSEIRYEGILYTVDTKESTIALAKVRSFGTEDRPTDHPVAARDEVYEYIIFKATDIKDLVVCETPKPVPSLMGGLPYDPAILQVSQNAQQQPTATGANAGISHTFSPPGLVGATTTGLSQFTGAAPSVTKPFSPAHVSSNHGSRSSTPFQARSESPVVDSAVQTGQSLSDTPHDKTPGAGRPRGGFAGFQQRGVAQRGAYAGRKGDVQDRRGGYQNNRPLQQRNYYERNDYGGRNDYNERGSGGFRSYSQAVRGNSRGAPGGFARTQQVNALGGNGGGYRDYYNQRQAYGNFGQQRPLGGSYRGTNGGGFGGRGGNNFRRDANAPRTEPLKFDKDYDFEEANEKFQEALKQVKDELSKVKIEGGSNASDEEEKKVEEGDVVVESEEHEHEEEEQAEHEDEDHCYNKTKSFFDRISCEALEKQEGKNSNFVNRRRERELNSETFGQAALRGFGGGYRGRGFGGRGRGGPMRRGGYYPRAAARTR